jgi:hypothetical protein
MNANSCKFRKVPCCKDKRDGGCGQKQAQSSSQRTHSFLWDHKQGLQLIIGHHRGGMHTKNQTKFLRRSIWSSRNTERKLARPYRLRCIIAGKYYDPDEWKVELGSSGITPFCCTFWLWTGAELHDVYEVTSRHFLLAAPRVLDVPVCTFVLRTGLMCIILCI